ncbi:hypothetical protein PV10_00326 [Exophiala mesophila]|uniref:Mid2 domain-containing protein n=1 Tax=Exophiala mesophila TaxID=212818 RepID=A0A0D1Y6W2_EXOME|nr:uncharacterized protein PV10_00326 [Exophiala mesophila]KIV96456.1 hypothetical protein PV10_00326 [Exophiala mesophila]
MGMAGAARVPFSWAILLCLLAFTRAQSCYYPNGDLAASDTPCTDEGGDSFCCSSSYYCLSNRICLWEDGRLYRGSCSDLNWASGECPQFCQNNNPGNGIQVWQCSITLGTYCCSTNNSDSTSCCGREGVELFTLPAPTTLGQITGTSFINFQTDPPSTTTTTSSTTSSTSSTTSSTTTPSTTSSSSTSTTSTSSNGAPTTLPSLSETGQTTSGSTTGTAPPSQTTGSDDGGGGGGGGSSNTGAIAGGAVGGVAVIVGAAVAGWWIWNRKHKSSAQINAVSSSPNDNKQSFYGTPQGGYYQPAAQNIPGEMDSGQQMIPQEMDSTGAHPSNWYGYELPADSTTSRPR